MTQTIDYYFSTGSPWTYLGHPRFAVLLAKHGAKVNVKPVDYGKIFPVSGGLPLKARAPQRQAYRLIEIARWRDFLGVPINLQPEFHPFQADASVKAVIAADIVKGPAAAANLSPLARGPGRFGLCPGNSRRPCWPFAVSRNSVFLHYLMA